MHNLRGPALVGAPPSSHFTPPVLSSLAATGWTRHLAVKIRISQNMFILIAEWKRLVIPWCSKFHRKPLKVSWSTLVGRYLISCDIIVIRGVIYLRSWFDRLKSELARGPPPNNTLWCGVNMAEVRRCHKMKHLVTDWRAGQCLSSLWSISAIFAVHIISIAHRN